MAESCQSMHNLPPLHLPLSPSAGSYHRAQPLVTLPLKEARLPQMPKSKAKALRGLNRP